MLVVRWVDRLGRDYTDVTGSIREFMRRGIIVRTIINAMTFDGATTDPVQMAVRVALIDPRRQTANRCTDQWDGLLLMVEGKRLTDWS